MGGKDCIVNLRGVDLENRDDKDCIVNLPKFGQASKGDKDYTEIPLWFHQENMGGMIEMKCQISLE